MSDIHYRYSHEGFDPGAPEGDTTVDLMDWMKEQLPVPTCAGGGKYAISDQTAARLAAVAAINDAVNRGILPRTMLDHAMRCQTEPPETFERVFLGRWNIPQEE